MEFLQAINCAPGDYRDRDIFQNLGSLAQAALEQASRLCCLLSTICKSAALAGKGWADLTDLAMISLGACLLPHAKFPSPAPFLPQFTTKCPDSSFVLLGNMDSSTYVEPEWLAHADPVLRAHMAESPTQKAAHKRLTLVLQVRAAGQPGGSRAAIHLPHFLRNSSTSQELCTAHDPSCHPSQ